MKVLEYFDLGLLPPEPELGKKDAKRRKKQAQKRLRLTILMYLGIVVGILAENLQPDTRW